MSGACGRQPTPVLSTCLRALGSDTPQPPDSNARWGETGFHGFGGWGDSRPTLSRSLGEGGRECCRQGARLGRMKVGGGRWDTTTAGCRDPPSKTKMDNADSPNLNPPISGAAGGHRARQTPAAANASTKRRHAAWKGCCAPMGRDQQPPGRDALLQWASISSGEIRPAAQGPGGLPPVPQRPPPSLPHPPAPLSQRSASREPVHALCAPSCETVDWPGLSAPVPLRPGTASEES